MGDMRNVERGLGGKPERKKSLGRQNINLIVILIWILKRWEGEADVDLFI